MMDGWMDGWGVLYGKMENAWVFDERLISACPSCEKTKSLATDWRGAKRLSAENG